MLKISDAVNLAFHAMLFLAADSAHGQLSVQDLAKRMGVSDNHLSKVMQRLAKAGLVGSKRGPKGGFYLVKPPEKIRLLDIYELIEGPLPQDTCLLEKPICDGTCCLLGNLIADMQRQIRNHLSNTTLKDVTNQLPCELNVETS
jgi:Rrf2 family protein